MRQGRLVVVGTGIRAGHQLTRECETWLKAVDKIVYCVSEPLTRDYICTLRPDADDLSRFYEEGKDRRTTYGEMVESILALLRDGNSVCAAFYGHPGIYVSPSHEVVQKARAAGFEANMLPGISSEACLYADLGIDPAEQGCLSYEATEWLVYGHKLDPTVAVILWQVDCVGEVEYCAERYCGSHVSLLVKSLLSYYPANHIAYLYQAAMLPISRPKIWPTPIGQIAEVLSTRKTAGTLFIPPCAEAPVDIEMAARLGIDQAILDGGQHMPAWSLNPSFHIIS